MLESLVRTLFLALFAASLAGLATDSCARTPRVGLVFSTAALAEISGPTPTNRNAAAFVAGMKEHGWIAGKNIEIHWRSAEGDRSKFPALLEELLALPVDVLLVGGNPSVKEALRATRKVPIVMWASVSPVEDRLVESFSRPGGNLTGLALEVGLQVDTKRLALLKEAVPTVARIAFLGPSEHAIKLPSISDEIRSAANRLGLTVFAVAGDTIDDLERQIGEAARLRADAIFILESYIAYEDAHQASLHKIATRHRLPVMHSVWDAHQHGVMLTYGSDLAINFRRAAYYVDRILKGTKPASLPIEQPRIFQLIVNRKAAAAIGLTIPPSVLTQADRVID